MQILTGEVDPTVQLTLTGQQVWYTGKLMILLSSATDADCDYV